MKINLSVSFAAALACTSGLCGGSLYLSLPRVAARDAAARARDPGTCSGTGANPWVYNFEVNGYPAKVLNDATLAEPLETSFLTPPNQDVAVVSRALKRRFLNSTHMMADNSVLYIDWDGEGMLFDAGSGPGEALALGFGMMFDHLEAEGISRDSIKHVLVTHGHFDHLAGVVEDLESLKPAYPHATIYISRVEYEFWTNDPVNQSTSLLTDEFWDLAISVARPVLHAVKHQLKTFELNEEVLPGIMPIHSPWHTPGHTAYAIDDGDSKLVYTGDSVNHRILAIENPWFGLFSDTTPEATTPGRYAMLDEVVREGWQVLCGHVTFPGLLHVEHEGVNFRTTARGYEGSGEAMSVCA